MLSIAFMLWTKAAWLMVERLTENPLWITTEAFMANEGYHEPFELLSEETRDMHRAIVSLMEELEAVDWYNQRIDVCKDDELRKILIHNRDEEKEHAAMTLEWIRRRDKVFDEELKEYLFTEEVIGH